MVGSVVSSVTRRNMDAMTLVQMVDENLLQVQYRVTNIDERLEEAADLISSALTELDVQSSSVAGALLQPRGNGLVVDTPGPIASIATLLPHSQTTGVISFSNGLDTRENHALPSPEQPEYDEGMHCFPHLLSIEGNSTVVQGTTEKSLVSGEPVSIWTLSRPSPPVQSHDSNRSLTAVLMYNMGQIRKRQGRHHEAYSCFVESYRLIALVADLSHAIGMVVRIVHNLGYIQYRNRNVADALQLFNTAKEMLDWNITGDESVKKSTTYARKASLAATLNCIGVLYLHMPKVAIVHASKFLMDSLSIQQEVLPDVDTTGIESNDQGGMISLNSLIASTLNNIGRVHFINGENELAIQVSIESLRIRRQLLGNDHFDVAATVFNLAHTYYEIHDRDSALSYCEEFLRITRPQLSTSHRDVAYVLKCKAHILHQQKKYGPAIDAYHEALTACIDVFGIHSEVAAICNKLGNLYYVVKRYDLALSIYETGLKIETQVLHPHHMNLAVTLSNMAQIHRLYGNTEEALGLYGQVYLIQVVSVGAGDPIIAETLTNIAHLQFRSHQLLSAYETYQLVLHIRQTAMGEDDLQVAATLNSMGLVLHKFGELDMALEKFMHSYEIHRSKLGDNHADVAVDLHDIAAVLLSMGKDEEALDFYQRALRVEQNVYGPDHVGTIPTLLDLVSLHRKNGEIHCAIRYSKEVLRLQLYDYSNNNDNNETSSDHDNLNAEMNGTSTGTLQAVNNNIIKTLYKIGKLHLEIGNVSEYIQTMSHLWRRSNVSDFDKIQRFTLQHRRSNVSDEVSCDLYDEDDDTLTMNSPDGSDTPTNVTTFDRYVISKLHPESASMA